MVLGRSFRRMFSVVLVVLVVGLAMLSASAGGQRLVVKVDEPYLVNGELYPAGTIVLRAVRQLTPVSTIDEVWAGRRCLGVFQTSRSDVVDQSAGDSAVFQRNADGQLVLVGYFLNGRDGSRLYRYDMERPTLLATPATASTATDEGFVRIASR